VLTDVLTLKHDKAGVGKTVVLLDFLVAVLDRRSEELVEWKPGARKAMDQDP